MSTRRPNTVTVIVVLAGIAVIGALAVCVALVPAWTVGGQSGLTTAERLTAQSDVRSTLLQGLGGVFAIGGVTLGALMTLRQVQANREGHLIDLFTKAIEQLASDKITVRQGGVYALEQLSDLDQRYRGHAHALLTAFVRHRAPWPPEGSDPTTTSAGTTTHVAIADDVAAAIGVLDRKVMVADGDSSELEWVDLRHAALDGLHIPRLCLAHSSLDDASLVGADLSDATLEATSLRRADLTRADLSSANLIGADLDGAVLRGADLSQAQLTDARLTGVLTDQATRWPTGFSPSPSSVPQ